MLLAWCLLGVGISAHDGEWSSWGLLLVVSGFAVLFTVVARGGDLLPPTRRALLLPAGVSFVAAVAHPATRLMHVHGGALFAVDALAAASAAVALLVLRLRSSRLGYVLGAGMAAVAGVTTVLVVTNPHIDVWYLLQQSSDSLARGTDMYRQHWQHSHGLQTVYPYLPLTTVFLAPFRWLLTDVRFGLLAASLAASALVRRLAPAAPATLALLLLVHPHWVFLVDQSWTEPLLLALLAAAILAIDRGRPWLAVLALAAALASKQHIVLLLPLFAAWPAFGWRRTAASAGLAAVAVLPWVVAGPHDFWHDAVDANLGLDVIPRALCVPSFLLRQDVAVGFWFTLLVLAVVYAVTLWRSPRTASGLALSSALVLWALDLANKQSFFNHYLLPLGLMVIAIAAVSSPSRKAS